MLPTCPFRHRPDACTPPHCRAKDTNSHHVVPASSLAHAPPRPEDAPPPFCKVAGHTDKRMELYCLMCEELACDKCALAMHSTHVIMDHSQAVVGQRRDVEAEIAVCSARGKTLGDGTAACQARIDSLKVCNLVCPPLPSSLSDSPPPAFPMPLSPSLILYLYTCPPPSCSPLPHPISLRISLVHNWRFEAAFLSSECWCMQTSQRLVCLAGKCGSGQGSCRCLDR
jgi:hypothetical protein